MAEPILNAISIPAGMTGLIASVPLTPGANVSFALQVWLSFDGALTWPKFVAGGGFVGTVPATNRDGSAVSAWQMSGYVSDVGLAGPSLWAQARLLDASTPPLAAVTLEAVP